MLCALTRRAVNVTPQCRYSIVIIILAAVFRALQATTTAFSTCAATGYLNNSCRVCTYNYVQYAYIYMYILVYWPRIAIG